ncbi:putative molibdopterin-dependent oxidoreductase YjgC [Paucibacter oligotrophus]|uniref:Putative molibdopterin-dependent oxidoreductase YjgC n=1 Tax=Roseateles oligotrophus TaxID=1769250 RepID=A0A840LH44_9BURK|nr:2Fe-2S iron-sulfur cluster-binding protein [Roseateles oligotrophus]MBB4845538.1 putative molibdopterin-dependent oxidoreductase YjgC [Roseateles oligotrophus]
MNPITLHINGLALQVAADITVAAALAQAGLGATRRSESGQPRAAFCGMGVCQECRVQIDGIKHRLACLTAVAEGMQIVSAA